MAMGYNSLSCQVCLTKYESVCHFKRHVRSRPHRQKMEEVFQKDTFSSQAFIPWIVFMDPLTKLDEKHPIVGLSLLTLCFSAETSTFFYLCHVCEEKRPPDRILCHLSSGDHCSSYFNYTDPNVLSFSWMPSMDMRIFLRSQLTKEFKEKGSGTLQMLDLPQKMMKRLETSTYSEVMQVLSENDKFLKLFEGMPKRSMIQMYQRDSNRKHPLLGMQHLIESTCVGPTEKRYYLCTLCKLTLAAHTIIKHVLSFDHIVCYFKAWHPSTLLSKECYQDYNRSFTNMVLDFAKQTEEIHGTSNADMKQVSLEPDEFKSVNFTCYAEALKKLESLTEKNKQSDLVTSVKPGRKLERQTLPTLPVAPLYKLHCQDCSVAFETIQQYLQHLSVLQHKEMLKKFSRQAESTEGDEQTAFFKPNLGLYCYLKESSKQDQVVGVSLVVACVCSQDQAEPFYVCFACQDCFTESGLREHFKSEKHLIQTLMYHNPWRLPFAWVNQPDVKDLTSVAWEEEKERGPGQMVLKVLDIPYQIFQSLIPPSYPKVMKGLDRHHTLLKNKVPQCQTYSKLKQNERFPLLGRKFLVMHDLCIRQGQSAEMGFLCLLCKRKLSGNERYAHVFSREHVKTFLDCVHPGSVSSSMDAETLLDLAKQAARIHAISSVQVIQLDAPIWEPCTYHKAICIMAAAKKRQGGGELIPVVTPKMKLSPRETQKEVDKDHVRDNSQKNTTAMEGSEHQTNQKSADNNENAQVNISVELSSEITNKGCAESERKAEKRANMETPAPSNKEPEKKTDVFSKSCPDEVKGGIAGGEASQLIKDEEKTEELTMQKTGREIPESCQNTDSHDGAETGREESNSCKEVLTQSKSDALKEKYKRKWADENAGREAGHKKQRVTSREDKCSDEPQKMPKGQLKGATTADQGGTEKPRHETAKNEVSSIENHQQAAQLWQYVKMKSREPVVGLGELFECHCDQRDPIYLCKCCLLKIPEKDIISHVTGFDHQRMYLTVLQKIPPIQGRHQRKKIRNLAAEFEQNKGYGEAQVVDLDEETYENISNQSFHSAIQTVKALQDQQDNVCEHPSSSALSGGQPEVSSVADNIQVVDMDIDSEDSEAKPSSATAPVSVMTDTTSKSSKVLPESNADLRMTHIKVPKISIDNANTSLTVSSRSDEASNLHVSKVGKTTGNDSKSPRSNRVGTSPTPEISVSPVATHKKPSGTASKFTVASQTVVTNSAAAEMAEISVKCESPEASAETVYMRSPTWENVDYKSRATTSCITTATTKYGEAADKCATATSSVGAGTAKPVSSTRAAVGSDSGTTTISTPPASSLTATTTKCRDTAYKCTAATSSATATASKCTTAKLAGSTSLSRVTFSNTIIAKSTTVSNPLESRTGAASKITTSSAISCKAAHPSQTGSTEVHEATHGSTPSETASKFTVASQTIKLKIENSAAAKMANISVKCETTEASAKTAYMKNAPGANVDGAPNIRKSHPPAAPHQTTAGSVRSEHKKPPTKPLHTSMTERMMIEKPPEVGLSHLIRVCCEDRRQVFCLLCSVRLLHSSHVFGRTHQYNYVKFKYPGWTAKLSELEGKLEKIVANLAEIEKDIGAHSSQIIYVKYDVYKELRNVPDDKAIERVKAMLRQSKSHVPASFTTDAADASRQQAAFASPCEVTSSDDGKPQPETPGLSTGNQPERENKHKLQTPLVNMPELQSSVKEEVEQSDGSQSRTGNGPGASDPSPDQLQSCLSLKPDPEPIPPPSIQNADKAVTVKQEKFEPDVETQIHVEFTPAIQTTAAVKVETPHAGKEPPATDPESARTFVHVHHTEEQESKEKTSPVTSFSPDPLSLASVKKEEQNQATPIPKVEHAPERPRRSPGPKQHSASQALPSVSAGQRSQGSSYLSWIVKALNAKEVVGLGSVWECQGISLNSFFLCESCSETLSINDIFQHMLSPDHQLKYMLRQYPHFVYFWQYRNLPQEMKLELLKEIAQKVSERERFEKMEVQDVLLGHELYECVRTAPFSEALEMVQNHKKGQTPRNSLPTSTPQEKDEQQSREESVKVEARETNQRSEDGASQKTEKHCLKEESVNAADLDEAKPRTVFSPLDVTSVSTRADSVVSPLPNAGTCLIPRATDMGRSLPPERKPPVSQHQTHISMLPVKQEEMHSESQSFCTVSPKSAETLSGSLRDKPPTTRKRPADTSVETLVRTCANNWQIQDPLSAKCIHGSLQKRGQPTPEPNSVNPTATSTPPISKGE